MVIVPTHNRVALLERCVRHLFAQTLAPLQIVIVDDASRDGTPDVLTRLRASSPVPLRVLRTPSARGPSAARNRGLHETQAEFVAFTDDDCAPDAAWLEHLVGALRSAAPQCAGVGGHVVADAPGIIGEFMEWHRILDPPPRADYLVTANCIYRRSAVVAVGGFDESIRVPGGEDPGLSFKLRARGFDFRYCERAVVRHRFRESLFDFARTFYRYGKGNAHVVGA
jgi:glycosyltransferase involved in cell wall biosynthesis